MASPPFIVCDDTPHPALTHIPGARVDASHFVPETGLIVLTLYKERPTLLAIGIGPITSGLGLLPRLPQGRANHEHPLVAALRAHLVGTFIRSLELVDDTLWLVSESANRDSPNIPTRLALQPTRQGSVQLLTPSGITFTWPPSPNLEITTKSFAFLPDESLENVGNRLVETNDFYIVDSYRRELLRIVRKKRKRLESRASAVQQDMARLEDIPKWQKIGSLLLAQGKTISRGTKSAQLVDWETNETIAVEIAPDKPAQDQAAEFFQKARRLQRGAELMRTRLQETTRDLDPVKRLEMDLIAAPNDGNVLREIAARMQAQGLPVNGPADVSRAKRIVPEERKPYHTFYAKNGNLIYVGRSGPDNDELVTRHAKPHDLWLHAKNTRGAHVVVPLEKNRSCPPDVLVDAATLAAHFSEARNEIVCEVSYVERRHVRKPKKAPPGSVSTQREKVIVVRIEKDRVSRLLGSKVET